MQEVISMDEHLMSEHVCIQTIDGPRGKMSVDLCKLMVV